VPGGQRAAATARRSGGDVPGGQRAAATARRSGGDVPGGQRGGDGAPVAGQVADRSSASSSATRDRAR
jgi:hypothetical protein